MWSKSVTRWNQVNRCSEPFFRTNLEVTLSSSCPMAGGMTRRHHTQAPVWGQVRVFLKPSAHNNNDLKRSLDPNCQCWIGLRNSVQRGSVNFKRGIRLRHPFDVCNKTRVMKAKHFEIYAVLWCCLIRHFFYGDSGLCPAGLAPSSQKWSNPHDCITLAMNNITSIIIVLLLKTTQVCPLYRCLWYRQCRR